MLNEKQKKLAILVNWIDRGQEWTRPCELKNLPSLEEMCLKYTSEPSVDELEYHLVMDDDEQIYALMTLPTDYPESEVTPDGVDFIPLDYAMSQWGCMHSLMWSRKQQAWGHV